MRYSLLNNTPQAYIDLWALISEEEDLSDVPPECITAQEIFDRMDNVIKQANIGVSSRLYEEIMKTSAYLYKNRAASIEAKLSLHHTFKLVLEDCVVEIPYIYYVVTPLTIKDIL